MAVEHRQLELCEYLLTHFGPLRSNDHLLGGALLLSYVKFPLRGRYNEKVFDLFVGKFDMDVDVVDACTKTTSFLHDNFKHLSGAILSHQSVGLTSWPIQERVRIAMRLENRPPVDFQRIIGLPMSELVQLSDAHLGTALHWAAKEWYRNAKFSQDSGAVSTTDYSDLKQFIIALLENKALLHALDNYERTPLACILDCNYFKEEDEPWIPFYGAYRGCAIPVESWGRLLGEAGVALPQYTARENVLLTRRIEDDVCLTANLWSHVDLSRFLTYKDQALQLEVTRVTKMTIWEFRPPPGRFNDPSEDYATILWSPSAGDGDRTCWQKTGSRELRSKPFRWTRNHELDTNEVGVFTALFHRTHDDHSALALLWSRDRQRRARESHRTRHRSSSMPPLGSACLHTYPIKFSFPLKSRFRLPGKGDVTPSFHRCLFDGRWGFDVLDDRRLHSWRACMSGCQGRMEYPSLFEEFLAHTASQPKRMASELERIGRIVESD